jgi:hypothetical protein
MLVYGVMAIGPSAVVIVGFLILVRYLDASNLDAQREAWARDRHYHW